MLTTAQSRYNIISNSNEVAIVTKPPSKERFLSIREVAGVFGVNIWTIKKWLAEGRLKGAYKLTGGRTSPWRVPQSAVDDYIRQQQKQRD